jgi:hypothetical protein
VALLTCSARNRRAGGGRFQLRRQEMKSLSTSTPSQSK